MSEKSAPVTSSAGCNTQLEKVSGITLYMQPVQDLTVEDRVSRTQFQYTLEDPNAAELNSYTPKMLAKLQQIPDLRDVASDQENGGLQTDLVYDRDTASRLGITPSTIDQTLYDSYGQREISTMFTQLNQYHVVLVLKPSFHQDPLNLRELYIRSGLSSPGGLVSGGTATNASNGPTSTPVASSSTSSSSTSSSSAASFTGAPAASSLVYPSGSQVPLSAFTHVEPRPPPLPSTTRDNSPWSRCRSIWRRTRLSATPSMRSTE